MMPVPGPSGAWNSALRFSLRPQPARAKTFRVPLHRVAISRLKEMNFKIQNVQVEPMYESRGGRILDVFFSCPASEDISGYSLQPWACKGVVLFFSKSTSRQPSEILHVSSGWMTTFVNVPELRPEIWQTFMYFKRAFAKGST